MQKDKLHTESAFPPPAVRAEKSFFKDALRASVLRAMLLQIAGRKPEGE